MLYLIDTNDHVNLLCRVFVSIVECRVYASHYYTQLDGCIIDIDEQEKCVLILQGYRLFPVLELQPCSHYTGYKYIAEMVSINEVIEWKKDVLFNRP